MRFVMEDGCGIGVCDVDVACLIGYGGVWCVVVVLVE